MSARTADDRITAVDAILLGMRLHPRDEFLPDSLLRVESEHGLFLEVDGAGRTSHPRIWAAGNVVNIAANVPMSMGAGSTTGGAVNAALTDEDTRLALRGVSIAA